MRVAGNPQLNEMVENGSKIIKYELYKLLKLSLLHNFQFNNGPTLLHG